MLDAVEDPVNRSLTVAKSYEDARQKGDQTVQSFAAYLATLEEQMEPYTPAQRIRHLLVKLRRTLCDDITIYHKVPTTRDELISLATRLERAEKKTNAGSSRVTHKHGASEPSNQPPTKKSRSQSRPRRDGEKPQEQHYASGSQSRPKGDHSELECFNCHEKGHIKPNCPKLRLEGKGSTQRRVTESKPPKVNRITARSAHERFVAVRRSKAGRRSRSCSSASVETSIAVDLSLRPTRSHCSAVVVAKGKEVKADFLLDNAADVNVVLQTFVLQHSLMRLAGATLPAADSFLRN